MVEIKTNLANESNYGSSRSTKEIKYIVIHYTGNDGDTDENNGKYFHNNVVKVSAHYFVDSDSITQSVPDNYIAYSVGGKKYSDCNLTGGGQYYGKCTNANSISIEICDDNKDGKIYPSTKTILNVIELTKHLMSKYKISSECVIRHFDVTGKKCPEYWVNNVKWHNDFKAHISNYFLVKIKSPDGFLNVRKYAGVQNKIVTTVKNGEVFTIVGTLGNWGKLKSGAGWINLKYTSRL